MAVFGCFPDRRGEGKMKIGAITLLSLALTTLASARAVPSCPAGSQQGTWKGMRGSNVYNCKVMPVKKDAHGLEQCLEWEGTRWSDVGVTVPCGSSVSSVSDSDQPEPTRFDAPSASELKALKAPAKAKAEQVVPFCPTGFHQGKWKDTKGDIDTIASSGQQTVKTAKVLNNVLNGKAPTGTTPGLRFLAYQL